LWTILWRIFWDNINNNNGWARGDITIYVLINAFYGATAVLISIGAVLGRVTPMGLMFIAFCNSFWYNANYYLCILLIDAVDYAGPSTIHTFGGAFGVACGIFMMLPGKLLSRSHIDHSKAFRRDRLPSYHSNSFAFIGTLIIFVTFPSFNAAFAPDLAQFRVAINTIVAIVTSVVFAFLCSRTFWAGKFHMLDCQHASLAGGIAIAAATAQGTSPGGAMVVGAAAGILSAVGYAFITPLSERRFGVVDEAGVFSGHLMPGLLGGIAGILTTAIVTHDNDVYGQNPNYLYPHGETQAGHQAACTFISLGIGLGGGLLTGLAAWTIEWALTKLSPSMKLVSYYSDEPFWLVPNDFEKTILSDGPEFDGEPINSQEMLVMKRAE